MANKNSRSISDLHKRFKHVIAPDDAEYDNPRREYPNSAAERGFATGFGDTGSVGLGERGKR